jgi:hypothetical protein
MRFLNKADNDEAILWYFANPPKPTAESDILILPGDMIGYSALAEYFRTTGAEGSQDKAEEDAENRFIEYLSIEVIPDKSELLRNSESDTRVDRLATARSYYANRSRRNYQS